MLQPELKVAVTHLMLSNSKVLHVTHVNSCRSTGNMCELGAVGV